MMKVYKAVHERENKCKALDLQHRQRQVLERS